MSALFLRHPSEPDLALFAGGELGPLARWRIEGHVAACAECREAVGEFFELRSRVIDLGELPQVDWAGMSATIRRRVASERQDHDARPWLALVRPSWAPALAILVLLALGGYISRRYGPPAREAVSLGASAESVESRVGGQQVLSLLPTGSQNASQVNWRVSADAVSARYVDAHTGNITVNNVYSE